MILCVGEILADMIGAYTECGVCYERKAGGAPFNVACAAKKFGADVRFFGSVGDDIIGKFLIDFARSRGFDGDDIACNSTCNTTLAFVELGNCGERSFCFFRKNTADARLPYVSDDDICKADIVHIGSLMLSEKAGCEYAAELADRTHRLGKVVSFDVNFRSDIFKDVNSALVVYKSALERADIIKMSEEEVEIFTERYIDEMLADKLVCITRGAHGSEWRNRGTRSVVPTITVKSVDTTGAGDAFYGGVLYKLDGKKLADITAAELDDVFRFGNICGALNTLGKGAIDALPSIEQIERALKF